MNTLTGALGPVLASAMFVYGTDVLATGATLDLGAGLVWLVAAVLLGVAMVLAMLLRKVRAVGGEGGLPGGDGGGEVRLVGGEEEEEEEEGVELVGGRQRGRGDSSTPFQAIEGDDAGAAAGAVGVVNVGSGVGGGAGVGAGDGSGDKHSDGGGGGNGDGYTPPITPLPDTDAAVGDEGEEEEDHQQAALVDVDLNVQ